MRNDTQIQILQNYHQHHIPSIFPFLGPQLDEPEYHDRALEGGCPEVTNVARHESLQKLLV